MPEPFPASVPKHDADPVPTRPHEVDVVEAAQILRGANEIGIRHDGQTYRLRITRANKLLLTK